MLVHVLHKTQNYAFSRRSRAKTGKKCTKKCDARAKLLFCLFNLLFFWRSRCRSRRWILQKKVSIECSHSRGQHLCKFIGTKESVSIRKEFNSHRTGLGHQHGRRFIVLGHQYGRLDVLRKHPQLKHQRPVFGLAHYKMNITFTFVLMTKKKHRSYFKGCLKNSFLFCGNEVQNCLDRC